MNQLNIFNEVLHECCSNPITGFFRDGFCNTNEYDQGLHIVCCLIDDSFLQFSFDQPPLNQLIDLGQVFL